MSNTSKINTPEQQEKYDGLKNYRQFKFLTQCSLLVVVGLSFVYLVVLNSIATRGFDLAQMKTERITLIRESEQLDIELAVPLSLYALQSSFQVQEMQEIEEKNFLYIKNGQVAFVESR